MQEMHVRCRSMGAEVIILTVFKVAYHFDKGHYVTQLLEAESLQDAYEAACTNTTGTHLYEQEDALVQINLSKVNYIKVYPFKRSAGAGKLNY